MWAKCTETPLSGLTPAPSCLHTTGCASRDWTFHGVSCLSNAKLVRVANHFVPLSDFFFFLFPELDTRVMAKERQKKDNHNLSECPPPAAFQVHHSLWSGVELSPASRAYWFYPWSRRSFVKWPKQCAHLFSEDTHKEPDSAESWLCMCLLILLNLDYTCIISLFCHLNWNFKINSHLYELINYAFLKPHLRFGNFLLLFFY